MKHRYLFFAVLVGLMTGAVLLPLAAAAITLNPAFELGSGGDKPAVAIGSDARIHTVWGNANTIQYVVCDNLDAASCATPTTLPDTGKASLPRIALDSQDRPNVVWQVKTKNGSDIYWSRLESGTWSAPQKISTQNKSRLPDIAIGPQDNIHIVYASTSKGKSFIEYVNSAGSKRFSAPVELDAEDDVQADAVDMDAEADSEAALALTKGMNPRVAADAADYAHVVWNAPAPYGVYYAYQTAPDTFTGKILVASKHKDQMPAIAIGADNHVAIVWNAKADDTVGLAEYLGGVRLYAGTGFPPELKNSANPAIAADCWGNFEIAYQGTAPGVKKTQIFHRMYDPTTRAFDEQQAVSSEQEQAQLPDITAHGTGAIVFRNVSGKLIESSTTTFIEDCNNPPEPTPTHVPQDATEHISSDDPRIAYDGTWSMNPDTNATDGMYVRCGGIQKCKADWSAVLTFVGGSRVEWETAAAKTFGKARVTVDGQLFEQVDFCKLRSKSAKLKFMKRTYVVTGDANTVHTLMITALGSHSDCAKKNFNYVVVDGFNVIR